MKILIVNEQDEIIDHKDRSAVLPGDIVRISVCWIMDEENEVLIAKRAQTKSYAGKWSSSCAGTNTEGETYESNIQKELRVEFKLLDASLEFLGKTRIKIDGANYFAGIFLLRGNFKTESIDIQNEEHSDLVYMSQTKLWRMIQEEKDNFIPGFLEIAEYVKNKICKSKLKN